MTSLSRRIGLSIAAVITSTCLGLAPAMADGTPGAPEPTSTGQVTDATPDQGGTDNSIGTADSGASPIESVPPTVTLSNGSVVGTQTVSNGISLTTIAAPTDANSSTDLAAQGTLVTSLDVTDTASFSMIGLSWQKTSGSPITLYAQTNTDGKWSQWYSFATTGADLLTSTATKSSTEAIWVGVSDGLRVQAIGAKDSAITGLQATLIDTTSGAQVAVSPPLRAASSDGFVQQPTIVPRTSWGALPLQTKYCDQQLYDPTDIAITVHHTAGSNDYTAAQSAGIVRGIQVYDYSNQYCDIGYNFLIDKYGTIFEGRGGGANMPVHGAHAGAWNFETVGISFMMNSMTAKPTDVALTSAEQLIAWKLANNYRDPFGTVTINNVKLNTIFMHKDVMNTACPGTYIIAQMGNIRTAVANIINSSTPSAIKAKWAGMGGGTGSLGEPFQLEQGVAGGRYTVFNNGSIYWSTATGAFYMPTTIATAYAADSVGGPAGKLGFPTSDPYTDTTGATKQDFQGGWITFTTINGVLVHYTDGSEANPCYSDSSTTPVTKCMLFFNAAGGVVTPASKSIVVGSTFGTLPTPARVGYSFSGWFSQASGGTQYTSATVLTNPASLTAYAQWKGSKYTVTFNANGGSAPTTSGKASPTKSVTMGSTYGTLPTTSRTGYTFAGWYTAKSGGAKITTTSVVTVANNQTLFARWTAKTYTVKLNPNGGKVSPTSQKVTYQAAYGTLATPTRAGYKFTGWYTKATGGTKVTATTTVKITATQTLYAHWSLGKYKVTFDSQGGSVVSAKTVTFKSRYGTLKTPKRAGYKFLGWYTSPTGGTKITATSTVKITKATTLYARWRLM